jgi:hypothetical protein
MLVSTHPHNGFNWSIKPGSFHCSAAIQSNHQQGIGEVMKGTTSRIEQDLLGEREVPDEA